MKKISNKKHFKGFTLVELIIVITILAILGTIAYISFQGYTKDARDGVRISDIKQIYNGLSIYKIQTEKTLLPDNYINIQSGTTTISYQGYAGASVLRTLKITGGKDPGTKDYYIYTTDVNLKKGQLMTYMETSDKDVQLLSQLKDLNIINQTQAITNTGYYQDKKIYVYGDKIGILTSGNNVPLQEVISSTGVDLTTLTGSITTYFGSGAYGGGKTTSTGVILINQINGAINNNSGNKYTISGTITNGSGGVINICGISTSIDVNGNFTLGNINYGTVCSGASVTKSGYNCNITTDGPSNLISNITNIAGSCNPNNCVASTQIVNGHTYSVSGFNHGSSVSPTMNVGVTNGTRTYQQSFVCDGGVVNISGPEINPTNICITGYSWDTPTSTCKQGDWTAFKAKRCNPATWPQYIYGYCGNGLVNTIGSDTLLPPEYRSYRWYNLTGYGDHYYSPNTKDGGYITSGMGSNDGRTGNWGCSTGYYQCAYGISYSSSGGGNMSGVVVCIPNGY